MKGSQCLFALFVCVLGHNCGSSYPDPFFGSIQGRLFYEGDQHTHIERVAAAIIVFATPVEWNMPAALRFYMDPVFDQEGMPYELKNLDPYDYTVLATLIDLDEPDSTQDKATGFYPNLCEAMILNRKLTVDLNGPVEGVNIHLYDNGGMTDPCLQGG